MFNNKIVSTFVGSSEVSSYSCRVLSMMTPSGQPQQMLIGYIYLFLAILKIINSSLYVSTQCTSLDTIKGCYNILYDLLVSPIYNHSNICVAVE